MRVGSGSGRAGVNGHISTVPFECDLVKFRQMKGIFISKENVRIIHFCIDWTVFRHIYVIFGHFMNV